jgi:hypothetical protein
VLARVKLSWNLSVSPDVVSQTVIVTNVTTDEVIADQVLSGSTSEYYVNVPEKTQVNVSIIASDGTNNSVPATLDFVVPDLSVPSPPTKLEWTITEVVEE